VSVTREAANPRGRKILPLVLFVSSSVALAAVRAGSARLDAADDAWERGDYIAALNGYLNILTGPDGESYVDAIARRTGEIYHTDELTSDGRAGRFSPDGRFIVYETGLETSRRTRVLRNDTKREVVAELPGVSATFSPEATRVAYFKVVETDDLRQAADALDGATLTQSDRSVLIQRLAWQMARDSVIAIRDLASGAEIELPTPVMVKASLSYAADGRTLFFLGAKDDNDTRTDIYSISETSDGPVLAVDAAGLKSAPIVDASGGVLVYAIPTVSPLRRPEPSPPRPDTRTRAPSTFGVADLISRRVSVITGTSPALSRDGRILAYVAQEGSEYSLMVGPARGLQTAVLRTTQRIDAPALSEDGARVAWQMMPRDDWEIYVADIAASSLRDERRVTREIQHDVLPRFITRDRLIAMVGEPRHRRSFLYDLSAPAADPIRATRLFHNNTIRTIAPEYQWAPSPGGSQLIVGAERDGDTVSPARGVYLVDLTQTVSKKDLLQRLRAGLRREMALKAAGARAFQPVAAEVRQILAKTSVNRIYGYEKALFDLDSKHITRPGNARAAAFLFDAYKSFGYEPEYQWFEPASAPGAAGGIRTANVVATLRGTQNPDLVYVLSSHYDSVATGPGADDDSSGTAALLEAARVLAGHPLPATVVFASMTGEESGLLGSREFVRRARESGMRIAGVLNNDMIGWTNDQRLDNTIRYSNPGIRDIQHAAAMQFTRLITYDALYWKGTDAMSFYDAYGDIVGGIGSYPVLGSPYYHQPNDVLENENHQLVAETSKATVATLVLLASSPSRVTNLQVDSLTGSTASISWTPSPEKSVTGYVIVYGPASAPAAHRLTVTQPHATVAPAAAGTVVSVKAVNARGLEGWDWARVTIEATSAKPRPTQP
jgi:hypothetical protein